MRRRRRLAFGATAAALVAALVGFAPPASAAYTEQPLSLAWHPAGPVHSSISRDGVVYVGGKLDGTGGVAALNADTGALEWLVPANGDVRALALSDDGSVLYAGGGFTTLAGQTAKHVAALQLPDHSMITSWKARTRGAVRDLAVWQGTVYIAGKVKNVDGFAERGIGAVDAVTGARETGFTFSADNDVLGLALTGDSLILGGSFTEIDGVARASLAEIDLQTGTLTDWDPPRLCSTCTQYWDVQTDGTNAYVATSGNAGGAFNLTTGDQPWPIVRGDGDFQAVWLPGDGRVYFGGHFGQAVWSGAKRQNTVAASVVAAAFISNGQIDPAWTPKIYSTYPGCWTFTSTPGKLWFGGDFTGEQANGQNNHEPYLTAYPAVSGIDAQAPTGSFTTSPATGWATWTRVKVTQTALADNVTPSSDIVRIVTWGDGTTTDWTTGTTISHVYQTRGTYTPHVRLIDRAHNDADVAASTVVVKVDATAPVVALQVPSARHSVQAWKKLLGTATDAGTGVRTVSVTAVEKRGHTWYGYNANTRRWRPADSKAAAYALARAIVRTTGPHHHWSAKLAGLRKGKLRVRVWAVDRIGNRSDAVTYRAHLTRH